MTSEWLTTPLPEVVEGGVIEVEWADDGTPDPGGEHICRYAPDGPDWRNQTVGSGFLDAGEPMDRMTLRWRWVNRPAETVTIPADEWARVSGAARQYSLLVMALGVVDECNLPDDASALVRALVAADDVGGGFDDSAIAVQRLVAQAAEDEREAAHNPEGDK